MTLTSERLHHLLKPRAVQFYPQVDSTNDIALAWLRQGAPAGSIVVADEQLKGRGRMGRIWHTPPGVALAVSVILHPKPEALQRISMMGALAICELADHLGAAGAGIKWPNDVQINERKISGVLPEIVWEGDRLLGVVLGMGINVRTDFTRTELAHTAVSLETALGRRLDRVSLLVYMLERLDYWNARLLTRSLYDAWQSRLTTIGHTVSISSVGELVCGTAESVDEQGALQVRDDQGVIHRVMAGDIALG